LIVTSQGGQTPDVWQVDAEGRTPSHAEPSPLASEPFAPICRSGSGGALVQLPEVKSAGVACTDQVPVHPQDPSPFDVASPAPGAAASDVPPADDDEPQPWTVASKTTSAAARAVHMIAKAITEQGRLGRYGALAYGVLAYGVLAYGVRAHLAP
jgi:hypothetical protein